jgi:hypothetical protein
MNMHVLYRHRMLPLAAVPVDQGDGVRFGAMFKFALADP